MLRITNRMLYNNALINAFRQNEALLKVSEQISSGKRVNRPSDDPLAIGEILTFKARINRSEKFVDLGRKAETFLNTSEAYVSSATELASRAKELTLSGLGGTSSAQTRRITAKEIEQLLAQAISIGNRQIGSDYIFGGLRTNAPPIDQNGFYQGNATEIAATIDRNATVNISVLASDFLASDLNPRLNLSTPLSVLRGGLGITAGSFTVTDRAGNTGTVAVSAGDTIGDVITAINASGANLTASISLDGMGIRIADNTTIVAVTGAITIADAGSTTATELGIAGSRNVQYFHGNDINSAVDASTLLSDLLGGRGLTPSDIVIVNGAASATISFAGATTLGDMITAINTSGVNATISVNSAGTGLTLISADSGTVAFARDITSGNTAELLGIGGGRNLISTLQRLQQAMEINDTTAIMGLIENLDTSIDTTTSLRGMIGARVNRITSTAASLDQSIFDNRVMLSNVQDTNMAKAATELVLLQTAYQATIKAAASIIQPSLLNFLG